MKKNLYVISSEKIFKENDYFYCDNIDMKSTPEGLNKFFNVKIIAKNSPIKRSHKIKISSIQIFSNLISYVFNIFKTYQKDKNLYLIVSLTPYTFLASIILKFLGHKPFLYLRSNGYDEYRIKLGVMGYFIYHFMFSISSKITTLISCREYILMGKKGHLVTPSQITSQWTQNLVEPELNSNKLIYIGRIRKEKGIFSLLNMIKNKSDINLTIVGAEKKYKGFEKNNINILEIVENQEKLRSLYDKNNIMILPSFTEGYPMVVLEALSRLRPVIIFTEIEHIIEGRNGIFVSKRNYDSLKVKINHIIKNYKSIQESMKNNYLPTNEVFINQIKEIILKF